MRTVWVFGDQLNRRLGALRQADPRDTQVLLVESEALLRSRKHVQRLHLVIAAMRRFASELKANGFAVDLRRAPSLETGMRAHLEQHRPDEIAATEPNARAARALCRRLGVTLLRSDQFLCHPDDFAAWADGRSSLRLEDFYRWQRVRLGYLMDDGAPAGGRWNYDRDNREPPPADPLVFSDAPVSALGELDEEVLASLPETHGRGPIGLWATTRRDALARLDHFLDHELEHFGAYEDAMTRRSWRLAHSLLSPLPQPRAAPARGGLRRGRGTLPGRRGAHQLGRGLHPPGHRLARVCVGAVLALAEDGVGQRPRPPSAAPACLRR